MQMENNFSSSVIFNINYLVEPNNCINTHTHTHTHTHTFARPLLNSHHARVIYNIITYKQRVCKKFFINFLHALFACINERIVCAKQGWNNV